MGLVLKQSTSNLMITVAGFGIGAINVLFLYTHILQEEYYGLVTFVLAFAAILLPLLALGMHNTMLRFYSQLNTEEDKDRFLTFIVFFPLALAGIWAIIFHFSYDAVAEFLTRKNPIVRDYLWYIYGIGFFLAYFEMGYAYAKVHLKSVLGNALKEVLVRLGVTLLLLGVYTGWIEKEDFLAYLFVLYGLRAVLMWLGALRIRPITLNFSLPDNYYEMIVYGLLMLLGASASILILEIDKVMLNSYRAIEEVAYYGVAIYLSTVIAMPYRAMYQITAPLSASHVNQGEFEKLKTLYRQSSLTLLAVAGAIFFLLMGSLKDLYTFLPAGFGEFYPVVFLVGVAKLTDSISGTANSILFFSPYYRQMLFMGVGLSMLTILLNMAFIPSYGAIGCALATLISVSLFNLAKILFIWSKFGFLPFQPKTLYTLSVLAIFLAIAVYMPFPSGWPVWWRIGLRSLSMGFLYGLAIYYLEFSPELKSGLLSILQGLSGKKNPAP